MREPGREGVTTFGRRGAIRNEAAAEAPLPDFARDETSRAPSPVAWALRTAAVVLFLALLATQYLVGLSRPDASGPRLAAGGPYPDPETTGSIGPAAQAQRLDPCAVSRPGQPR